MFTRRAFVAGACLGIGCSKRREQPVPRAARYLWNLQAEDGGWHSQTYGLLRSGQSLTGFVLDALLRVPKTIPKGGVERALTFIQNHVSADGSVGRKDPTVDDYPTYATACSILAMARANRPGWQERAAPMVGYLRAIQYTEENRWGQKDPAYGGWGIGGERRIAPHAGHIDLSMTRHAMQALAVFDPKDLALWKARFFVNRCWNADGGFFFSTVVEDANKAGRTENGFRSYGTATADGLLARKAAGPGDDDCFGRAAQWLQENHRLDGPGGFTDERWRKGLLFYYAAASAEALGRPYESLLASQRSDGSWANPESLVKEDDPLIATAFAIKALQPG